MEETFNIKAIILKRQPFSEDSSRVTVYSEDLGKLELAARSTKKIKSKLAGHLEPFNLADIMVVRGRQYDYVGAAFSKKCYLNIKNNLAKLAEAGKAVKMVDKLIKPGLADSQIFKQLEDYLDILNSSESNFEILNSFFILKLLVRLGYKPELYFCLNCREKIKSGKNEFDLLRGGLVCGKCSGHNQPAQLTISDDCIKLLRLTDKYDLEKLIKIKINKKIEKEIKNIVGSFLNYYF